MGDRAGHIPRSITRRERELADLLDTAAIGLHWLDSDGTILWASRAELKLLGYTPEEYIGHNISEFHAGAEVTRDIIERLRRRETLRNYEARLRCKDGSLKHVLLSCNVLWEAGRFVRTRCFTRDITERKQVEQALRESEERFRTTADATPALVWMAGPEGLLTYVNRRWLEFSGRRSEEELGRGWTERVHPDDRPNALAAWAGAFESRAAFELELRLRRGDGEYRWVLQEGAPRFEADASFAGYVGVGIDVTERKRSTAANASLLARAEEAGRAKDAFLATLSHELRTPLNAIAGWAYLLRSGTLDAALTARAVEVIERNARLQSRLVSDLLDTSQVVSGKLRLNMRAVDLPAVVEGALETARPAAEAKGVRLQAELDPAAVPVLGDPDRLHQVLWNLLSNGIKFTPRGGRVRLGLARGESHFEIKVEDTGLGIEPAFLPHLFERFRQADNSPTRGFGGLGLGLALVRHLVEMHGGTVSASSAGPGHGAAFTVKLPRMMTTASAAVALEWRAASATPFETTPSLAGVKVLIVKDDADARDLIATVLEERGALTAVAESAAEGFSALPRFGPDVLVSDIEMPHEDGYSFIRRVRALPAARGGRVPAAAITAYARVADRMRALLAGFQAHLAQPVQPVELVTVVASLAGRTPLA